jgi:ribosomal protein L37AE/L43A
MPMTEMKFSCPFCKENMWNNDEIYECHKCGCNESVGDNGEIWTHVPVPVGWITVERKKDNKMKEEKKEELVCKGCGGKKFILNSEKGEQYCEKCGLVIELDNIDFGRDWRFSEDNHQGAAFKYSRSDNDGTFLSKKQLFYIKKSGRVCKQKMDDSEEEELKVSKESESNDE